MQHAFPLPLACVPPSFTPIHAAFTDALEDATTTFYLPQSDAALSQGLVTSLQTRRASSVATLHLVTDVVGSGKLAPAALARLRAVQAGGAPWWLVVHGLEALSTPEQAIRGGNLLMMLLERGSSRFEGIPLTSSAALLVGGAEDARALQRRWEALLSSAPPARGQTPLNTVALFGRIAKASFPPPGPGSGDWPAALHSARCGHAPSSSGSASSASASSAPQSGVAGLAGLALLGLLLLALYAFRRKLWATVRQMGDLPAARAFAAPLARAAKGVSPPQPPRQRGASKGPSKAR